MKKLLRLLALAGLCAGTGAGAQEAPAADTPQVVHVVSNRDPDWKTYAAFVAGMRTFDELHGLAPRAPLRFILRPQRSDAGLAGVTLHLKGNTVSIPVAVAPDGSFVLPYDEAALEDNTELVLNRKKGSFRWRPDIHTPDVPANARRLGDLRLECRVRWAVEQHELPFLMRKVFNAAGGPCHSSSIKVDFLSPRPVAAIRMVAPGRSEALAAKLIEAEGRIYLPPLHDDRWPDETLVEFTYVDGAADKPADTGTDKAANEAAPLVH